MRKFNKNMIFAGIFAIAGLLILLLCAVLALLSSPLVGAIPDNTAIPFVIFALLIVAFGLLIAFGVLVALRLTARKKEENKFVNEISAYDKGELLLLSENGEFFGHVAKSINRSTLLKEYHPYEYGIYKESKFDDIVLETLENQTTSKAGLVFIVLSSEKPIKTKAPRDALIKMVQEHFGEKTFYGRLHNGVAVFLPHLPSKEEFLGKIRRTVQLFSYTEDENHISSKAGVAFYPDYSPKLLTSEALKATLEELALNVHAKEELLPHLGFESAEKEAFLIHRNDFLEKAGKAPGVEELDALYKGFVDKVLPYLSADSIGVTLYKEAEGNYELVFEDSVEKGASFSLLSKEGRIAKEDIDPFYELSVSEMGSVTISDANFLPTDIMSRLSDLALASMACQGVELRGKAMGFIYVGGKEKGQFDGNKEVLEFLEASKEYVLCRALMSAKHRTNGHEMSILSAFGHYAYGVAKNSFNLSHISPNLAKAIPEAKVGMPCYEALFGEKAPCQHCPLFENDVEKMMPRLSSGVFAFKSVKGDGETLLVLSPHKTDFSPSRIDPNTGLLSDKSLHEDLQNEVLLRDSTGLVLAFRLRNVDAIARLVRTDGYEEEIKAVADALSSAGLSEGLYRNGGTGFAYLLPYTSREDAYALAGKISRKFSEKIPFHGRDVEFIFDYVLVSYPLEAETPFALDSLLRTLYLRADASSRGRLFEVNNEKGRLVDIEYYTKTKLEEGLRAKSLPVVYGHYDELSGKRVAFLEAQLMLEDELGERIDKEKVEDAAKALARGKDVHLAIITSVCRYLGAKRKEIASKSLHGIIVRIDPSCFSEGFVDSVMQTIENNNVYKKHLFLQVSESDMGNSLFPEFLRACRGKGIPVGLAEYKGDLDSIALNDFAYVSFPAKAVYGVNKKNFLWSLSNVRRASVNVLIDGYRDNEERRYLGSLTFHYGKKADEPFVKENEVVF